LEERNKGDHDPIRKRRGRKEEAGSFAFTATDFIKFFLFNYIPKNKAVFYHYSLQMPFEISSDTTKEFITIYAPDASRKRKKILA
jgi:hypothetical protein